MVRSRASTARSEAARFTGARPAASSSSSARASGSANIERDPPLNSFAMSTTCTSGNGLPFARSGRLT